MGTLRRLNRRRLRLAGPDEQPFSSMAAVMEAIAELGVPRERTMAAFLDRNRARTPDGKEVVTLTPAVVAFREQGGGGMTYRFNDLEVVGTREEVERRWRTWMIALLGDSAESGAAALARLYRASKYSAPEVTARLKELLVKEKIL
jgi:hypothetical protein